MHAYDKCGLIELPATINVDHSRHDMFSMTSTVLVISVVIVVSVLIIVDRIRMPQIVEGRRLNDNIDKEYLLHAIEKTRKKFQMD